MIEIIKKEKHIRLDVLSFLVGEAGLDFHFALQNKGSATSSRRWYHPTQFQIVIHFSSQSYRLRSEMNGLSHGLKTVHWTVFTPVC